MSAKRLFKSHSFKIKVNKPADQLFSVVRICATPMAAENEEYNTDSVNQSVYWAIILHSEENDDFCGSNYSNKPH